MHSSALAATFLGLGIDDLAWLPCIPAPMSDQIETDTCLPKKRNAGSTTASTVSLKLCRLRGSSQGQDLADAPHRNPLVVLVRPTHIRHKDLFECTHTSSYMPWRADSSRAKAGGQQEERSGQPDLVQQFTAFGGLHFDDLCMPPVVAPLDLHKRTLCAIMPSV